MEKKFELTDETIVCNGHTLYRIKALKDFGNVKTGRLGGFVESENNLSQHGECWIDNEAKVYDEARVSDNAKVYGNAEVYNHAEVFGNAEVSDDAHILGNAKVYGNAEVYNHAEVFDNAWAYDSAVVCGDAKVYDNAQVFDKALVSGNAKVYGKINGYAEICGNAEVKSINDYAVFKNFWSSGRYFTWTKSNNMWKVGCFYGTGEELVKKAYEDSDESGKNYEIIVNSVKQINSIFH